MWTDSGPRAQGLLREDSIRTGRQLGRVAATLYEEVAVDRFFPGNAKLTEALQPLMMAAEVTLALDESRRPRTLLRIDVGGGSLGDVKWCLERGYQIHCKDFSSARAESLASILNTQLTVGELKRRKEQRQLKASGRARSRCGCLGQR